MAAPKNIETFSSDMILLKGKDGSAGILKWNMDIYSIGIWYAEN